MNELIEYNMSDDLQRDLDSIVENAQQSAMTSVNTVLVLRNWLLGMRISRENMNGSRNERYGEGIISKLSEELTQKYGKGFDKRSLYRYVQFYQTYPEIVGTLTPQSDSVFNSKVMGTLTPQFSESAIINKDRRILTWSHYERLLQVSDSEARAWYEKEAIEQSWSVHTLRRNINTQYYERTLLSTDKKSVEEEMKENVNPYRKKYEFLRNPIIADFLGMEENRKYHEPELEKNIIVNLEKFMMEIGKGFAFVERQQRIHTEKEDYYIDIVFYNYILKCFVLVDLKIGKITHQDVGQMDMYVRMYDELRKQPEDNPTLGIVLCSETDEDIARYSILHGNEQLFASNYRLCLPTEEQLRAEIESQKEMFYVQHPELDDNTDK